LETGGGGALGGIGQDSCSKSQKGGKIFNKKKERINWRLVRSRKEKKMAIAGRDFFEVKGGRGRGAAQFLRREGQPTGDSPEKGGGESELFRNVDGRDSPRARRGGMRSFPKGKKKRRHSEKGLVEKNRGTFFFL